MPLVKIAALRLIRDVRIIAALTFTFVPPVAMSWLLDPSAANSLLVTTLVLPLAVGWYWGDDLADGRLIVYAVGSVGRLSLLVSRIAVMVFVTGVLAVMVVLASGATVNRAVLIISPCYMVCIGFVLATL